MRVFICDDSPEDRERLKEYFFIYAEKEKIEFVIYEYPSAEALLENFEESKTDPTLVFLDIFMGKMTGIDSARKIYESGFSGNLVFTTISGDYAVESYELGAEGYLKKPYTYANFVRTMQRCQHKWAQDYKYITVSSNRIQFRILLKKIEAIESHNHCCFIYGENDVVKTRKKLKDFEDELKEEASFIRCGRSFIINLSTVVRSHESEDYIHLQSGRKIPLPIRDRLKIKGLIAEYYWKKTRES